MASAALFLNGEQPTVLPNLTKYNGVYCADGAYHFLKKNNKIPTAIIGDFDSVNIGAVPISTEIFHFSEQDTTDFEKALIVLTKHKYLAVDVFGASGGEQDHFLGNLSAALKFEKRIHIKFYDDKQTYWFAQKKETILTEVGKKLSLFPFPEAYDVTASGLMYAVNRLKLSIGDTVGTRNITTQNQVHLKFTKGSLVVFLERSI